MRAFGILLLFLACHAAAAAGGGAFTVLCYHETRDDVRDYPDPFAVDSAALVRQFAWLRGNGYVPVRLDDIIASRSGGKPLPDKAVLLTFDDAYLSFYTRVYPLLREFGYPALLGVVGKWIDVPRGAVRYGEKDSVLEASFPSWAQLREMADSGLVELASHSYDLHLGLPANPQGNLQPAATTRTYDVATGSYEGDASWRARVRADLAANTNVIERETGRRPRAMAWPYGVYNDELVRMAAELGMPVAMTLEDGVNTPEVPLNAVRRILVEHNPALAEFASEIRGPRHREPLRVVQADLANVYSSDPAQQERNLSALLDRAMLLQPTHVFLRATADTDADGTADAAWFPNRHLPLRADLFNRAAWQLDSRVDVKVYAVMPVSSLRLSQAAIVELYEDLARHASIDGLVFDDGPQSGALQDAATLAFTQQLATRTRAFRAPLKTVRTVYNEQDAASLAAAYDYVALSAPAQAVSTEALAQRNLVFLMQHGDAGVLASRMRALQRAGALHFGYGPDAVLDADPPRARVARAMSLRIHPLPEARPAP